MYGIIESLCFDRGMKPGKLCSELGISRGIMGDLKSGRTKKLSAENIKKIAEYFEVSTDYILTGEQKKPTPDTESERNVIRIAGRDGSYIEKRLTDEQIAALKALISQLPEVKHL